MFKSKEFKYAMVIYLIFSIASLRGNINIVLANIKDSFPNEPITMIQLCSSILSFVAIPVCLLVGPANTIMSKKRIILIGLILSAIGGVGAYFGANSLILLIGAGAIVGIGFNFFQPAANALVSELFEGEQRTKVAGRKVIVQSVLGIGIALFSGYLVLIS